MPARNGHILQQVPEEPDSDTPYLFYLHGLIVELGGKRPKSEEHGYYEYEQIVQTLADKGFTVISEVRPKNTEVTSYAEKLSGQIRTLLDHGVQPHQIYVVGASKGGAIAAYASMMLREKDLNFVFLAGLFAKYLVDDNLCLYGNVLAIHDRADTFGITPLPYFERSAGQGRFQEIVLDLDLGHGIIYRPLDQWLEPLMNWADMS